jgi:hypothetical protein
MPKSKLKLEKILEPKLETILETNLDSIASALILLEPDDMPALAGLHDQFHGLTKSLHPETPELSTVSEKCVAIIEKLILRDIADAPAALENLGQAVSALRRVIREKRTIQETGFPESLFPALPVTALPKAAKGAEPKPAEVREHPKVMESAPVEKSHTQLTMEFAGADASLVGEFISEGRDHCLTAEQKMMDIETGADFEATINAVFRSFHSIKRAAGFLALHPIGALAHESETLLDL